MLGPRLGAPGPTSNRSLAHEAASRVSGARCRPRCPQSITHGAKAAAPGDAYGAAAGAPTRNLLVAFQPVFTLLWTIRPQYLAQPDVVGFDGLRGARLWSPDRSILARTRPQLSESLKAGADFLTAFAASGAPGPRQSRSRLAAAG